MKRVRGVQGRGNNMLKLVLKILGKLLIVCIAGIIIGFAIFMVLDVLFTYILMEYPYVSSEVFRYIQIFSLLGCCIVGILIIALRMFRDEIHSYMEHIRQRREHVIY
jgi:hypothetical protein